MLAPVPAATQDKLAKWVDGHVDALVKELTPEDDTAVLAAEGMARVEMTRRVAALARAAWTGVTKKARPARPAFLLL